MTGYAVFIGVAEYEDEGFTSYETVGRSVERLKELFRGSRLWGECSSLTPVTPQGLIEGLRPVVQETAPDDVLLVYFCGHGELIRRGDQYTELHLATRSSTPRDQVTQLPLHQVYDELHRSKAMAKVLVLDCCNSGGVPALGTRRRESADIRPDPTTSVLKALRGGEPIAYAERKAGDYTAFSGALIDILSRGIPGADDPLSINDVFQEMVESLSQDGYPAPDVISRGIARLPLLENVDTAESHVRDLLGNSGLVELARMWKGKPDGEDVPVNVVRQHLRGRLGDGHAALEIAHELHQQSEGTGELLRDFVEMVVSGPDDLAASTAQALARSDCAECAEFCGQLLRRAVVVLSAEPLIEILLVQELHQRAENDFATLARPDKFTAVLDGLRRRQERHSSAAVDRLIELFATRRNHSEVRELLAGLRAYGREFDADTVLIDVALGRSPADAAGFVQEVRKRGEHGGPDVSRLVVERRRPREVAAFIAGFGETADSMMRHLLPTVAEQTSADWMIRLVRALRANGLTDAPSAIIGAVLHRGTPSTKISKLLDGLADCGPEQSGRIETELYEHLRHSATPVDEVAIFLRRTGGPGRPEVLMRNTVSERHVDDLIELHRYALTSEDDQLAERIAHVVSEVRGPLDLMDFLRDFESAPAVELFTKVAQERDGETIGHLLSIWELPDNRPVPLRQDDGLLPDLFGKLVPPDRLLAAHRYLESMQRDDVLDPVLRKKLESPQQLDPGLLAAFLVALSQRSRKPQDFVKRVADRLEEHFTGRDHPLVGVDHLARTVAEVCRSSKVTPQFSRIVAEQIDRLVLVRENTALSQTYLSALWTCGADERARAFKKQIDP